MILIDATALQSEHRLRGVGSYLRELVRHIERDTDARPRYLASWHGRHLIRDVLPPERTLLLPRPHRPAQVYWLYNEAFLRAGLLRARPRVLFAPDFNGLVSYPFGATVAALHDLTALKIASEQGPDASLSALLSDWRWRAYYRKLQRADHVIAISESAKRDAIELLGLPPDRFTVIHHGVDHARFRPIRGEGPFAERPPYFLNVGGRGDNKNQARILRAFARATGQRTDVHLYFAGPWNEADLAWLRRTDRELGLDGRAQHLGYVPDDDLPSLFANAFAFLFPSLEEGFGLPVLEAMAAGTPVVTSTTSALPEVAGHAALLVDPTSVDDLATAMARLIHEPELRESLIARGRLHASEFTWQLTATRTARTLNRVVS